MGFSPNSPKQSIMVYKKKNHYNEWEFVYDPVAEQMMQQAGGNTGNNPLQTGQPGAPTTPTSPTTPTAPIVPTTPTVSPQ
jgi:hypothetical protein